MKTCTHCNYSSADNPNTFCPRCGEQYEQPIPELIEQYFDSVPSKRDPNTEGKIPTPTSLPGNAILRSEPDNRVSDTSKSESAKEDHGNSVTKVLKFLDESIPDSFFDYSNDEIDNLILFVRKLMTVLRKSGHLSTVDFDNFGVQLRTIKDIHQANLLEKQSKKKKKKKSKK